MAQAESKREAGIILVVDDDKLIRGDITRLLREALGDGAEIVEAYDGRMAMQKLESTRAGIVLTDMRMPRMDGLALIEAARGRWPDVQFIVLSNYDDFDYVKQSFQHGIVDYMLKYQIDQGTLKGLIEKARKSLDAYWHSRAYRTEMRKNELYEEGVRLGKAIAESVEACTTPPALTRLAQPAWLVRLDCLPQPEAPGEWRRPIATTFAQAFSIEGRGTFLPFVLPRRPGKEKLQMGVVAIAPCFNPSAMEITLRERVDRFFAEAARAQCVCAAVMEPLVRWDGRLMGQLDAAAAQLFYLEKCEWVAALTDKAVAYQAAEEQAAFAHALLEGRREDALTILRGVVRALRQNRPDPHAARKLLGRFLWEVQARSPMEGEQLSTLAMQRLSTYEQLIAEAVRGLPMMPRTLASSSDGALDELIESLLADLSTPVSIDEAAKRIGFSRAHFCRLFKQATGSSYNSFITQRRIERACTLLRHPKAQLRVVASAVGFDDVRYFRKVFFQHMHMSVDEWVRRSAGGER